MLIGINTNGNIPVAISSNNLGKTAGTGDTKIPLKYLSRHASLSTLYLVNTKTAHYIKIPSNVH